MSKLSTRLSLLGAAMMLCSGMAVADKAMYEVTITNITRNTIITPVLVASHRHQLPLFELGAPPSDELAAVAEGGDIAPMSALFQTNSNLEDLTDTGGPLLPGASATVQVSGSHRARHISLVAMMVPTNDSFISLNAVRAPWWGSVTYYSPGYDAGSEPNDELCVNIPGPQCGGEGRSPNEGGEGYVHINNGIQGIGDLSASLYDWRNPVAKITITRMY